MTERTGGSDVSRSETIATKSPHGDHYLLSGYKFFTSAITSECTLLLGKTTDKGGHTKEGSRGLSCFFLKTRDQDGKLNNMVVHKLKNKLGTKALPTAEMELIQSVGKMVGPEYQGVKVISSMLNITRIHNASTYRWK